MLREVMAVIIQTSLGDLKVELACDLVPKLSENFLALAASGYYEGTKFHRNIRGFMVQGGDPTGKGKGGECIWGGKMADEFHKTLKHDRRGVVSMANKGPDTNGSQFFITYAKHPHLDRVYSIIGHVIHGMEVLDAIEKVPVGKKNRPVTDIIIKGVKILANPLAK